MDQIQFKIFGGKKDGMKYKIIQITDIAVHTDVRRPTSVSKEISRSFQANKPGRIYTHEKAPMDPAARRAFVLGLIMKDAKIVDYLKNLEQEGYKVLIELPLEGIPLVPGSDTIEFIRSKNGQRLLRGLAKQTPQA